jgi:hypothetical protein
VLRRFRPRLTYANVIATLALFLAIGGGAVWAAGRIGTSQIKNGAVTTKKIKNNAVTGAKAKESSFGQVPDAANGYLGFARVSDAGNVTQGKHVASVNVTHPQQGYYCFKGLSFTPKSILADPDTTSGFADVYVETGGTTGPCANKQAAVVTLVAGTDTPTNNGFFVLFN